MKTHVLDIGSGRHFLRRVYLEQTNELEIQVATTGLVDVMVMPEDDYRRLFQEGENSVEYYGVTQELSAIITFTARESGMYCFVVDNQGDETVEANIVVAKMIYL